MVRGLSGYLLPSSSLRFPDAGLEERFRRREFDERWRFQLFALRCGLVFYASLGVLDWQYGGPANATLLCMRFVVALPLLLLLTQNFAAASDYAEGRLIMSLYLLTAGGMMVAMILVSNGTAMFAYPAGIMVIIYFGAGVCGHDFRHTLLVSLTLIIAALGALMLAGVPVNEQVSAGMLLLATLLIVTIAGRKNEVLSRMRFNALCDVDASREKATELYRQACSASHARGQFLAVVSHELRTPLNAIVGFSELMSTEAFGPVGGDRYRAYTRDILSSGHSLAEAIENIIDVSRADLGRFAIIERDFDPVEVVSRAITMCAGIAHSRSHSITFHNECEGRPPRMRGDEARWQQAVINLLVNAIKFTPPEGAVTVLCQPTPSGGFAVTVTDTGPGILAEDIDRIRQPFSQASDIYSDNTPGLGLGLSIVDRIAEAHGGSLIIRSDPGNGSAFTIEAPASRMHWPDIAGAAKTGLYSAA